MDHTEDHLLVAIREVVRCLFTPLEGMAVLTELTCRGNVVTSWFASDKYRHWQMA
ncbi:hypothetical protein QMR52_004739 [Salmonella enterica]|nr:hypothetical protein [Salmonella enterica]